jgi:hypothetical protein
MTETILWQSHGIWDNGHERTITKHGEFDPDDPLTEVRAGTGRKLHIWGSKNQADLSGNQSRFYTHVQHDGTVILIFTYTPLNNLENISTELFSCHDEGGDKKGEPCGWKRFGGVTYVFYLTQVKSKVEYFHKSDKTIKECKNKGGYAKGKTKQLQKKLVKGQKYRVKVIGEKMPYEDGKGCTMTVEGFIDYDLNGNFTPVGKFTQEIPLSKAPGVLRQALYYRVRTNSKSDKKIPKDIPIEDLQFIQVT